MKLKNLQITSPTALDLELHIDKPICVFHGESSILALDLVRELIGDDKTVDDPDRFDDGHFVIHSDIEIDGKNYAVCYIRNADFMGDNRIAANFVPNSLDYSKDDTVEFIEKCNQRDSDASNIFTDLAPIPTVKDDRPAFVYLSDGADGEKILSFLISLSKEGRQVFVAMPSREPSFYHADVQSLSVG